MAGFDAHKNLAVSAVVTAPTPATSGTSLTVTAGEGQRFPAVPFNATVWPVNALPTPLTGEVIRVTGRTTDALTITRAQEGSTARAIGTGDLIAATITAKTLTDLETRAALKDEVNTFTIAQQIASAQPRLILTDTIEPANSQRFDIANASSRWLLQAMADNGALQATLLQATRVGDIYIGRDVYEKGRTTAMGEWIDIPHDPGLFSANTGTWVPSGQTTYAYMLVGHTIWIAAYFANTTITGAPVELRLTVPGFSFSRNLGQPFTFHNVAPATGWALVPAGTTHVKFHRDILGTAWTAGLCHLSALLVGNIN